MTYEKAYDAVVSTLADGLITAHIENRAFWKTVKDALEKQMPKKPNYIRMLSESIKVGACPICNAGCNYAMSYCENCGQALDWDDTEDLNKIKQENKQEPKKVIVTDDECLCPSCKFDMMGVWDEPEAENPNYCPRCGQALDWSD